MSHRTLARRLSSEGITFSGILDELKTDLAKSYLNEGNLQISQISWLLGYREVSAFTHAPRRWNGVTQGRYEKQVLLPETEFRIGSDPGCRELTSLWLA